MDPIVQLKLLALAAWAALAVLALGTSLGVTWLFDGRDRRQSTADLFRARSTSPGGSPVARFST